MPRGPRPAHPRRLPGIRADLDAAGPGARVVVIGAGFIGSEVAATCHGLGARVTVVEALPTPLAGVLGTRWARPAAHLHRAHGVDLLTGVGVDRCTSDPGGPTPLVVHLVDGTDLEADLVVVGIGVVPAVDWLDGSGLTLDNGVVCDRDAVRRRPGGGRRGRGPVDPSRRWASSCGSSTGPTPPRVVPPPPATCWPARPPPSPTTPSRSSGPTSTRPRSR